MKILFDSNVIIDAITKRSDANINSVNAYKKAIIGDVEGYISVRQLTDINYVIRKYVSDKTKREEFIKFLTKVFKILPFSIDDINLALTLEKKDFEDNTLIATAINNNIEAIVTSNIKDFKNNKIKILEPKDI